MSDRNERTAVRRATKDDKTAILALDPNNELYEGDDYVPANFDDFARDPDMDLKVICVDGTIVSNCSLNISCSLLL